MSTTNHRYSVSSFASSNSASQRQLDHIIPRSSSVSEMVDIDDKFIRKPKNKPAYVVKRNSRTFNDAYQSSSNQYNASRQQQQQQQKNNYNYQQYQNYYPNQQYQPQYQPYPQQQRQYQPYSQQQRQYQQQYQPYYQQQQQQYSQQYQQQRNSQYEQQKQYQKQQYQQQQQPYSNQFSNQYSQQNQGRQNNPRQHQYSKSQSFTQQYPQQYVQQIQPQMHSQRSAPPTNNISSNSQLPSNLNIQKQQQQQSWTQSQTRPFSSNSSLNIPQRSTNRPANQSFGKPVNNSFNKNPNSTNNMNNNNNNMSNMNSNINPDYLRNSTPGKSSPSTTTTSDSSTSINRTPVKQSSTNSNSKNNISSPLTDISSNEDLDTPNLIPIKNQFQKISMNSQQQLPQQQVNYGNHPILSQKQHKVNSQNSEYNNAALAARTAVKNKSVPITGKQHFPTPIASDQQLTSNLKSIPPPTPVPTNSVSSAQNAKKDSLNSGEKKSGFFRKIFSRSKSNKPNKSISKSNSSSTLSSSTSSDARRDSKFSLRRISLIRTASRTSSKSQNTSRSSSIDIVRMGEPKGMTKQQNSSKSSLSNSVSNVLPNMHDDNNLDVTNNTMRIFTPVTEAGENNSSFNTISNADLPLSNRTISPFNSEESANYDYIIDLKKPIETIYNSDSTKHSLIGTKSENSSFYSANEFASTNNKIDDKHNDGSNRIIREKNSYNHLRKTSTQATQITQATNATQATQNTQYSEKSEGNDFDNSLLSISKIDSKVIRKAGHDKEVVELGYLSTIAGLGETNFFNTRLTTVNTNKSNKSETAYSTSQSEINENGVIKLSAPGNNENKTIKKKASINSLKVREEKKGLITKLGRKIPFIKLRERFDFSFDDIDDTTSKHDGYKNHKILEDEDESIYDESDASLNYDNSFFQDLKNKHILPFDYVPKHHEIEAMESCMKDEDNIENLMHSKNVEVGFVDDIKEGVTFGNDIYDRSNPDMKKVYVMMTYYPREIRAIRIELNDFKKNEMVVNEESKQFTHIFAV